MASPHEALFNEVRCIPAADAAERLNIRLTRRGNRAVALCPFHGEDTASLTFYPNGRFYCFGCHEHGGAIELYQKVLNLPPLESARAIAADFNIIEHSSNTPARQRKPTAYDLKRTLDAFQGKRWYALCAVKHSLLQIAYTIHALFGNNEVCAESSAFWKTIQGASKIEIELYQLEAATPAELLKMAGRINVNDRP